MLTLINFISLVADPDVDPEPIINDMSIIVGEEMEGFPKVTRRYKSMIENRSSIVLPDIDGEVRMETTHEGRLHISMSCFLPTKSAITIEQKVILVGVKNAREQQSSRATKLTSLGQKIPE